MIIEISIDTNELTDRDKEILTFLGSANADIVVKPSEKVEETTTQAAKAEKTTKRPPAKPVATRKPEPEPEPEPEDESVEDSDTEEEAPAPKAKATAKAKPAEEGPTMGQAVEAATKLVSSGKTAEVKAALASQGVRRVSELKDADQIAAFLEAVDAL